MTDFRKLEACAAYGKGFQMLANALYVAALVCASPMILYRMLRQGRYRRGLADKLLGISPRRAAALCRGDDRIWIHAVSVGEVNLLPQLVRRLEQEMPGQSIVVSTSTDTGYDVAVKHFGSNRVFFCPLDFTWAVNRTLRNLAPGQLVLTELELWPNLIRAAANRGCPVRVINGRLSQQSATRYQQLHRLTQPIFAGLSWVGCQDEASLRRFAACGVPSELLQVTGSLKFDDAPTSRETSEVQACAEWAGIDPWHRVWIAGSTHANEEQMAIDIYQSLKTEFPELRLILVPRHQQRFDQVASLIIKSGLKVHRRSKDQSLFDATWQDDTVILVDTIGELRNWWGVGQIATVGGSFGDRGGQNMLEPAGYGSAVSFGPNTRNFEDIASRLLENGGAVRTADQAQLHHFVKRCLTDVPAADSLGRSARQVVRRHRGATEKTLAALCAGVKAARRAA